MYPSDFQLANFCWYHLLSYFLALLDLLGGVGVGNHTRKQANKMLATQEAENRTHVFYLPSGVRVLLLLQRPLRFLVFQKLSLTVPEFTACSQVLSQGGAEASLVTNCIHPCFIFFSLLQLPEQTGSSLKARLRSCPASVAPGETRLSPSGHHHALSLVLLLCNE